MNYCALCNKKINTVKTITNKCKCNNLFCDKHLFYKDNSSNNILELSKLSNKIIKI